MFTAKAGDVVGEAQGSQIGNAVNLRYTLNVPYNKSTINLKMDDWMYQINTDTVLNRTAMRKFGLKVGEVVLIMKKKK